jgi:hypothetical protein
VSDAAAWLLVGLLGCSATDATGGGSTSDTAETERPTTPATSSTTGCGPLGLSEGYTIGQSGQRDGLEGEAPVADLVRGVQGGWHVDAGAWVTTEADEVGVSGALRADGVWFGGDDQAHALGLLRPTDCGGDVLFRLFADPTRLPDGVCGLDGQTVELSLTVAVGEEEATLQRRFVARIQGVGAEYCACCAGG